MQAAMAQVGFEPANPVFERAKTVHALDCAATVIGKHVLKGLKIKVFLCIYEQFVLS
jgi:hypothetical protein